MASQNTELVRQVLAAATGASDDFAAGLALIDAEIQVYPRSEEPGVEPVYSGHQEMFEYFGNWFSQWDEYEAKPISFEDAPEDRVLVVMAERGHLKQSGITLDQEFTHSFTVRDGKVIEWRMYDSNEQGRETLGLDD